MMSRNVAGGLTAGLAVLALTGCSAITGDSSDDDDSAEASPVSAEIKSWDACEVLDNMQPVWDYMQIHAAQGSNDSLTSHAWGEGMDGEALTCNGLVTVKSWALLDGSSQVNDGELWGAIVPWENEEQAQESYAERTGEDIERLFRQNSSLEETARIELGSEWDEGVLIVLESPETGYSLNVLARDGQWMIHLEVNYVNDGGEEYFYNNEHRMDGQTVEDFAYPFEDEELQQWLVNEYVPQVHEAISSRITQG